MQATKPLMAIITQDWGQSTNLVSRNKRVKIWHRRFGHISNAWVVRPSRLLTKIENLSNTNYDPTEFYNNSKESKSDTSLDKLDSDTKDLKKGDKLNGFV